MAMAVWGWYYTAHISQWMRFMVFIKDTKSKCCHRASTHSNRHQSDMPTPNLRVYFIVKMLKKVSSCPNNNRGLTYQTDEKHLNNMAEYFVGVVKLRRPRGTSTTSRHISLEFLFIKTCPPDNLDTGFRRRIERRNWIRYVICQGGKFWYKGIQKKCCRKWCLCPVVYGSTLLLYHLFSMTCH